MNDGSLLGIDVGAQRIGVAQARLDVRIPQPLTTLDATGDPLREISRLVQDNGIVAVIVGWPRGMLGQSTDQTAVVEAFVDALRRVLAVPVHLQDEALTSQKAEAELAARRKPFTKADVDALAATYILEDYLSEHGMETYV